MTDPQNFNPRSPHGERLSTSFPIYLHTDFNPRSPHGERRRTRFDTAGAGTISIHAPRTGSDGTHCPTLTGDHEFQSTLPARGATRRAGLQPHRVRISIHAPRTGSDKLSAFAFSTSFVFQSTLPARGATLGLVLMFYITYRFQSTLPARGATCISRVAHSTLHISIHAPRTGSDSAK